MARKLRVPSPRVKMLPRSAAMRGSLGGRPTKSGTKASKSSGKSKRGGTGRAVFG
jgi:hypothetical protein